MIGTWLVLFIALTFNAYACLVPIFFPMAPGSNCADTQQEMQWQFCDTFKTLGFNGVSTDTPRADVTHLQAAEPVVVAAPASLGAHVRVNSFRAASPPVEDQLLKTAVLRI